MSVKKISHAITTPAKKPTQKRPPKPGDFAGATAEGTFPFKSTGVTASVSKNPQIYATCDELAQEKAALLKNAPNSERLQNINMIQHFQCQA